MKTNAWLKSSGKKLKEAGIGTARLDTLVLLEDATGNDRAYLLAHTETVVKGPTLHKLEQQIEKRVKHIPLAQIRGKTEFYGREFIINSDVLEPRPESETMIELLKQLVDSKQLTADRKIIDIGTGSGAIGITVKSEIPELEVILTDIDPKCLVVAKKNAMKHHVHVKFYKGNLLEPLPSTVYRLPTTFLCNLPYVPDSYKINEAALNEPKTAIFGGQDGLDLYRKLFKQLTHGTFLYDRQKKYHADASFVFTESLPFQHEELANIARKSNYKLIKTDDFIQVFTPS